MPAFLANKIVVICKAINSSKGIPSRLTRLEIYNSKEVIKDDRFL